VPKPEIVVWIKPYCPWCHGVLNMLKKHGLSYDARDVIAYQRYYDEMVQLTNQEKAPCVRIDGNLLADTSDDEVEAWLTGKGYLKKKG